MNNKHDLMSALSASFGVGRHGGPMSAAQAAQQRNRDNGGRYAEKRHGEAPSFVDEFRVDTDAEVFARVADGFDAHTLEAGDAGQHLDMAQLMAARVGDEMRPRYGFELELSAHPHTGRFEAGYAKVVAKTSAGDSVTVSKQMFRREVIGTAKGGRAGVDEMAANLAAAREELVGQVERLGLAARDSGTRPSVKYVRISDDEKRLARELAAQWRRTAVGGFPSAADKPDRFAMEMPMLVVPLSQPERFGFSDAADGYGFQADEELLDPYGVNTSPGRFTFKVAGKDRDGNVLHVCSDEITGDELEAPPAGESQLPEVVVATRLMQVRRLLVDRARAIGLEPVTV